MRRSLGVLAVLGALAAGCGEIVIAAGGRADLRLDGPVTITREADGTQTVSGRVVNLGDVTADDVRVTVMPFVESPPGFLSPWTTVILTVVNEFDGTDRLRPGDQGSFAVAYANAPPILEVDVKLQARFRSLDGVFFFFFTPGLVIIGG